MRQTKKHIGKESVNKSMQSIINKRLLKEIGVGKIRKKFKYPDNFIKKVMDYIKKHYPEVVKIQRDKDIWWNEFIHIFIDEDDGQPTNILQHPLEWKIWWDVSENLLAGLPEGIEMKVTNLNKGTKLRGHTGEGINESRKDIKKERDDIERAVQDLNRFHNFDVSYEEMVKEIENTSPVELDKEIWRKLENTESNDIEKDGFDKVFDIANKYNKSNPLKLKKKFLDGTYNCPLIVRFEDRYWLVAGNTRLCTAAAMGMTPLVIIADLNKPYPVDESTIRKKIKNP